MASLEDTIRSAAPGGNIGKPLLLALLALLASGALFKNRAPTTPPPSAGAQPASEQGTTPGTTAGLLGGLGGLLSTLENGGLGNAINSWVGTGANQSVSPNQLGSALGPDIIKTLAQRSGLSEEEVSGQLSQVLPNVVDKLTPSGRVPTASELSQMLG